MRPVWLLFPLLALLATGCAHTRPEKVPGETDYPIERVTVAPQQNSAAVDMAPLLSKLGSRPANALYTARRYNPFRIAEDRRRIESYLQTNGYFDATVSEAKVSWVKNAEAGRAAVVLFEYEAGRHYALASLDFKGLPEGVSLDALRKAKPGGAYDLETLRIVRYDMAATVQRAGYGHAHVYVRTYVDRTKKDVHVVYLVDAGPRTKVGTIRVEGNKKVLDEDIRERLGLSPGDPFSLDAKEKAESDLRDTGAFNQVVIETNADTEFYLGDLPDTGGVIPDERIDESGELIARKLSEQVDLVVHVDEAPRARVKLRASAELDPNRIDFIGATSVDLLHALGSQHHIQLRGRVGVGHIYRGESEQPTGLYGDASIRYVRPGLFARTLDGRITARFRDQFYPGFHLRELTLGPGMRSTITRGLFFDLDAYARLAEGVDFGPFSPADRDRFRLPSDDRFVGAEGATALVLDGRDDPVEAKSGHLLALRGLLAPLGSSSYAQVAPEVRGFVPLGTSFAVAARGAMAWAFELGDNGIPLGPRLFGGGSFGMRGYGRDRLSPVAPACVATTAGPPSCIDRFVGGLSLAEASLELRYLPYQKQTGITVFTDLGGAGARANPFAEGVSMAAGLGPRLRLWYVPLSVDISYRFLDRSAFGERGLLVFARIGEAF